MSLSMYQASVPVFLRNLNNLKAILDKAATNAEARKIGLSVFINARLAPDMLALPAQIQIATDAAKGAGARLAGVEVPSFEDNETTFPELLARIAKTIDFLKGLKAEQIDGSEERTITLKLRGNEVNFTGANFLLNFALPNFWFHYTTAYAILRHNGVDLGKMDYLGGM
ncbi:MAG TPA: DUF1993 domain-containing protein [Dongiaceae bacterium]|nr:DUF1993 domain-containing protein [Dongiaceae bacterium]